MRHTTKLEKLKACQEAVEWSRQFKSGQAAWDACERGDWLLWYAAKMDGPPGAESRKKLVLAACKCARLSLKYAKKDENRPYRAIEAAEAWCRNENNITLEDVKDAAAAAYDAYAAADAYAYAAATADAYNNTLACCADIVRSFYPKPPRGTKG